MDFFAAQDHARRTSRKLVLWFILAILAMIGTVYAVLVATMGVAETQQAAGQHGAAAQAAGPPSLWNPELLAMTAIGVGGFILLGSLFKVMALARNGGARIAEELGGRLISRSTTDPSEQQLINIVDEMAIASGIPAPPVYVLDAERNINAFAAGMKPTESVIGVTRGALEQFDRDELQGVIAHEFSHILNGDMRLNLRLIGLLHGILLLTLGGRMLMFSARRSNRNAAPIVLTGLALIVVGYIGVLFGKFIKAAVSRQREYLADASAVQFTRNPNGIAGALKRIAGIGSKVEHPRAEEASHMFFGTSADFSGMLATHPPIEERIRRIDPSFEPDQMATEEPRKASAAPASTGAAETAGLAGFSPTAFTNHVGNVTPDDVAATRTLMAGLPQTLIDAVHQPRSARTVLFALLLSSEPQARATQYDHIETDFGAQACRDTERYAELMRSLPPGAHLPLLDLGLPTLREFSEEARFQLIDTVDRLIDADKQTSLFEFVTRRLLHANLEMLPQLGLGKASARTLKSDTTRLLALLARAGETTMEKASQSYSAALKEAPMEGPWEDFSKVSDTITVKALDLMLNHLGSARPAFRKGLIKACATAITHDGKVTVPQLELLRAICQALDCPAPSVPMHQLAA